MADPPLRPPHHWAPAEIAANPRARRNQGFMHLFDLAGPQIATSPEEAWKTYLFTGSLDYLPPREPLIRTDTLDLYHQNPDYFNRIQIEIPRCTFL